MFKKNIKVLDCTIRDGGLMNKWQFSKELVKNVYDTCVASGIDYMEIGYISSEDQFPRTEYGPWKFCAVMRKVFLALPLLLASASIAVAQNAALTGALIGAAVGAANSVNIHEGRPDEDYIKIWFFNDGPLELRHFQPRHAVEDIDIRSELFWLIDKDVDNVRIGNMKFLGYNTKTGMDMLRSWFVRGTDEDWILRYNRMVFNMVEYNRRELQRKLNEGEISNSTLFDYYGRLINSTENTILYETNLGTDTTVIKKYEDEYQKLLADSQESTEKRIPSFEKRNWGWGIYWHAGYEKYMGGLTNVVDGHFNVLGMTMESQYKKFVMDFDMYLSPGRKPNAYIGTPGGFNYYDSKLDWNWTNSRKIKRAAIDFRTGFNVFDKSYLSLIPHIGIGIGFLDQETDSKNPSGYVQSSEISGVRYQAGLAANVKIRRILNSSYIKDYSEFNVFTKLSFIRTSYKSIEPSNSICLSIGLGGIEWFLK